MARPNDQIGPYTLISKLGRGAFGVVWLAEKRTAITTTKVAIKIPNDEDIDLEAIRQEASLWVHASGHPNVLPIIDADIYDEQVIIVSEYAPDGSLSKWLEKHGGKAPSIDDAVRMTDSMLAGLEHLHERGIIHRDLKPDNILLQRETPRLADFGIARILKTTSKSTVATGTPAYMPPEAFDGRRSEQTDIWSAGVVFYQLLSGRLPFPQTEMTSLIGAIITREPAPLPDSISISIRKVVEKALQKSPAERYQSAEEMRKALHRTSQHQVPDISEAKTQAFTLPAVEPPPTADRDISTQPEIAPTVASPTPKSPTEQTPSHQTTPSASFSPTQPMTGQTESGPQPNRMRWIAGAIAVVVIGLVLTIFLLNRNSSGTNYISEISPAEADRRGIAALVNGKPITMADVNKAIQQQTTGIEKPLSAAEMAQARLQVLDALIQQEVLFQSADKEGLLPTEDEITEKINKSKMDSGMTEDEFQKMLKGASETPESFRDTVRKQLAIQRLQDKATRGIKVNDEDVVNFYNSNRGSFINARGVRLSVIKADAAPSGVADDAKSEAEAKQKIDIIYRQLKSGADFATVARARSEDANTVTKDGDIGFSTEEDLKKNGFPQHLIQQFLGPMQFGDITQPVNISGGWYIFKLTEKRLHQENLTLESPGVRSQIVEALLNQRKQIANTTLLETAKNQAKIVNYLAANAKPS